MNTIWGTYLEEVLNVDFDVAKDQNSDSTYSEADTTFLIVTVELAEI